MAAPVMATPVMPSAAMVVVMEMRELMEVMEMTESDRPDQHGRTAIGPPWAEGGFVESRR